MVTSIVPEGQTDADRIADFVNGYLGKNKEQNKKMDRAVLGVVEATIAYKLYRMSKKARRGR